MKRAGLGLGVPQGSMREVDWVFVRSDTFILEIYKNKCTHLKQRGLKKCRALLCSFTNQNTCNVMDFVFKDGLNYVIYVIKCI